MGVLGLRDGAAGVVHAALGCSDSSASADGGEAPMAGRGVAADGAAMTPFRYLYHHGCTAILPSVSAVHAPPNAPQWMREQTHGCWCSAWRIGHGGRFMVYRRGGWREPARGEVKSKVTDFALAPIGAVEALTRPTRAKPMGP